jgi:prepilin-type processing-associated H-X9-DG protein
MDQYASHGPGLDKVKEPTIQKKNPVLTVLKILAVLGIIGIVIAMMLPAVRAPREAARRNQCMSNLKQIALALKLYAEVHHALPPAYTTDADGKPLHSWRTLILPFMEEQQLYKSIDLTKPWDDPVNAEAFKTSVSTYQCPSAFSDPDNRTIYLAVLTPNSCFRAAEPRSLSDITDDASQTLMVIEVYEEHAVPWMSPVDADEKVALGIAGPKSRTAHPGGGNAAFVDGSVRFLKDDMPATQCLAMISIAGNDKAAAEGAE